MDIRPSRAAAGPVAAKAPATPASLLHDRLSPSSKKVLDLRNTKPVKASAAKPKMTPGHWMSSEKTEDKALINHHQAIPPTAPSQSAQERHLAHFEDRFKQARGITKSNSISKFHPGHPSAGPVTSQPAEHPHHAVLSGETSHMPELPQNAAASHEAMANLAARQQAGHNHDAGWRPHLNLSPKPSQYLSMAAAIAIMGGYIWLQNYPKMTIQSAGNKAGISASMPGYVPSSYTLANTHTAPGLVTLDFTSPSQPGKLSIAQHRTTWDSVSLLDQYINGKSPDYTAIEGQGLTVYLYGQNQATWVNHGIWYNIEGATRLSRDQILKIAYSL